MSRVPRWQAYPSLRFRSNVHPHAVKLLMLLGLTLSGCDDEPAPAEAAPTTARPSGPSIAADPPSASPTATPSVAGPPEQICGNGVIDEGELCDDGNTVAGTDPASWDGCGDCLEYDPGFGCWSPGLPCEVTLYCGDGRVTEREECDDLNEISGDGCASCRLERGWECPTPAVPCVRSMACGNGELSSLRPFAEHCDDGNVAPGDGCDEDCWLEAGWICRGAGETCEPWCGDGIVLDGLEECDDGNAASLDGCSAVCRREAGFACDAAGACRAVLCGDGVAEGGEVCDNGSDADGDGCTATCALEPECGADAGACRAQCGDGHVSFDEEDCDDANRFNEDGCDDACRVEAGFVCASVPCAGATLDGGVPAIGAACSSCSSVCGDSIAVGNERCDQGMNNGAGYGFCSADCLSLPGCGDGLVDEAQGEECDNGVNLDLYIIAQDSCAPGCVYPSYCGDGFADKSFSEECDFGTEGNTGEYDGCDSNCLFGPRCGDGVLQTEGGEVCDDDNRISGDGCDSQCQIQPNP